VLSLLHERTSSYIGDPTGQELCLYLTQKACVPYMEILEKWVYKGVICDPYQEVSCCSIMEVKGLQKCNGSSVYCFSSSIGPQSQININIHIYSM